MEKKEIIEIIDTINDYRLKRFRRDNLQEQYERMSSLGYEVTADDRKKLLSVAQKDLDVIEPRVKELIMNIEQRFALHPQDKALKLIVLHIEMLNMEPNQMEKQRQKINALRQKVLGLVDEIDKLRNENSLFSETQI